MRLFRTRFQHRRWRVAVILRRFSPCWHTVKNHIVTRKRQLTEHPRHCRVHCRCNFLPTRLECVPLAQPPQQNHAATYGVDTADNQIRRLARGIRRAKVAEASCHYAQTDIL